jgi:phosphate transport system protein
MLREQIRNLTERLAGYARLVEGMIERTTAALVSRDPALLAEVVGVQERRANELEVEIAAAATAVIAQFQPKARDLRTVLMVLGITDDLERLGDHAVNIAEAGRWLLANAPAQSFSAVPRMAEAAVRMIDDAITAFIAGDAALARRVCESDAAVDGLAESILRETEAAMAGDPSSIEAGLRVLKIAGNLERIADLATNIGEDVIYMVDGRVIKHHRDDP